MAIYAIGDLHLSFQDSKPMDIFGDNWLKHEEKIKKSWEAIVKKEDTVLLPGDFSWAMDLKGTYLDFSFLEALPGKKILLKGNHDYWWTTLTSMRNFLQENHFDTIDFLSNNAYLVEDTIICGTRGWDLKDEEQDSKIFKREVARLEMSLKMGRKQYGETRDLIVCMHYPPINPHFLKRREKLDFLNQMKAYGVKECLYGHLHGKGHQEAVEGDIEGIQFKLVSADYLDFQLKRIQ